MKSNTLLLVGLGVCSGTLLVDRFIMSIPDRVAIVAMIISGASLGGYILLQRKSRKKY